MRIWLPIALGVFVTGCTLGPDPEHAIPELPDNLKMPDPGAGNGFSDAPWKELVVLRELRGLVSTALAANADLKVAGARIRQARARAGIEASRRFAQLDAVGSAGITRQSEEENAFRDFVNPDRSPIGFGVDFSWEIDWWGRIQRGRQAASYELQAKRWDQAALQTQVVALVVGKAIDLQALFHQLEILERQVEVENASVAWAESRVQRGDEAKDTLLDTRHRQAKAVVEAEECRERLNLAKRTLPELCGQRELAVDFLRKDNDLVAKGPSGPLRAGVVMRRPDVAASIASYRRAVSGIGVAEASRWPEIQIVGRGGQLSSSFDTLVGSGATSYGLGLDLRIPAFDGGAGRARTELAFATAEEAHAAHVSVVLRALRDVGSAADRLEGGRRIRAAADRLWEKARERMKLARRRVSSGETSAEPLRRQSAELAAAEMLGWESKRREAVATVDLYRALGGGWRGDH